MSYSGDMSSVVNSLRCKGYDIPEQPCEEGEFDLDSAISLLELVEGLVPDLMEE